MVQSATKRGEAKNWRTGEYGVKRKTPRRLSQTTSLIGKEGGVGKTGNFI